MAWVKAPGLTGKVYVPDEKLQESKKHPCKDCFACQMCSDDRCSLCRKDEPCSLKRKNRGNHH
jgi:hypothetical protein